jgi:hypothetical protein
VPPRRDAEQEFRTAVEDPEVHTMADLCRALGLGTGLRRQFLEEGVTPHRCEGCARTVWRPRCALPGEGDRPRI